MLTLVVLSDDAIRYVPGSMVGWWHRVRAEPGSPTIWSVAYPKAVPCAYFLAAGGGGGIPGIILIEELCHVGDGRVLQPFAPGLRLGELGLPTLRGVSRLEPLLKLLVLHCLLRKDEALGCSPLL